MYLVGAGPGDPELLTVKAQRLIASAAVILHDDLVPPAILALAGPQAEVVSVGKRYRRQGCDPVGNQRAHDCSRPRGMQVVRLKGGDPGIFGRLAEEIDALEAAGVPFEVVPGITAGIAAAASLGVSLTDRRKAARVVVVTNHQAETAEAGAGTDWRGLIREDSTLVIYMPGHDFAALRDELLAAGCAPICPPQSSLAPARRMNAIASRPSANSTSCRAWIPRPSYWSAVRWIALICVPIPMQRWRSTKRN